MKNAYIVAAKRTPIGRFQGALKSLSAPQLGSIAVSAALKEANLSAEHVQEIIMGEVLTAGVGQAPARQAAILAGLPKSVEALTIGKVCGSGLKAVMLASQAIQVGDVDIVIAGGQESMSNAPYLLPQARDGFRMGNKNVVDSMINDGLWDPYDQVHMGNCGEICAREYKFSREEQDRFATESYQRALRAMQSGAFKLEIAPVEIPGKKGVQLIQEDEEPGASDLSKMSGLKPAFDKDGTITAANASKINDGAAACVVVSEDALKKYQLKPLARIVAQASFAQEPKWFTTAPVFAMQKVLKRAGKTAAEIDLFEINEAFSVVTMAAMKDLGLPSEKVNIHGGAVALGHPIGASGCRILTTLVHALHLHQKKLGLATLCIGGGEASALIIERC